MLDSSTTTPSNVLVAAHDDWSSTLDHSSPNVSPSSAYIVDPAAISPSASLPPNTQNFMERPASEEDSGLSDSGLPASHSRSNIASLPDPSHFPDPYPYRHPRLQYGIATPALSSTDSASMSTRSSAYTNSARSGDYGHVHVVLSDAELKDTVAIDSDDVDRLLRRDTTASSVSHGRGPYDQGRWSDLYANSTRSRSPSVGNGRADSMVETGLRPLRATPSFDMGWQAVDERDEAGLASDDETTDDDAMLDEDDQVDEEEQPTSAMVLAEDGRGIIVRGDDGPIFRLQVKPGTTHLLIGSSSTPNAVPSFLGNVLPQIANTLLALDISANFLLALPPALAACVNLEELNIASNPIRALPEFLARLVSLRLLIVDSTGISALPESLDSLDKLHTLSIRRNKLNSLPSWLCLLPSLETLLVDGNPFQGPWKALVEPLLAKTPMSPVYPPSTPIFPLPSASLASNADTDVEDPLEPPLRDSDSQAQVPVEVEEEDTITPARAPHLARSVTAPVPAPPPTPEPTKLSRTRTTPNRAHYEKTRAANRSTNGTESGSSRPPSSKGIQNAESPTDREVRRMKSAGELRRNHMNAPHITSKSATSSPQRPTMSAYVASSSSSNLLDTASPRDSQMLPKRFASLGVATGSSISDGNQPRLESTGSGFWENIAAEEGDDAEEANKPMPRRATLPRSHPQAPQAESSSDALAQLPSPPPKEEKEKNRRWGFLKKMSMGKMRSDSSPRVSMAQSRPPGFRQTLSRAPSTHAAAGIPKLDVRISTGALLSHAGHGVPLPPLPPPPPPPPALDAANFVSAVQQMTTHLSESPPKPPQKPTVGALQIPTNGSATLLSIPSPTPRATKRRSFLPVDMSPIPIPAASSFLPGVVAANSSEEADIKDKEMSPAMYRESMEEIQHREEERAREARVRALRSVMAYLRDMHDLGLSQAIIPSIDEISAPRSRRPTVVDNGRLPSDSSMSTLTSVPFLPSRPGSAVQLRSPESRIGLRSGSAIKTNSVATTDSGGSGSGEERKYKDDKAKRARIIREIVETERTYVKGLQELVDIYIVPASAPVNVLSGVGQRQETVVPSPERKVVFSGLEALFIFHKDSFLPALERAAAPVLIPSENLVLQDADGYLSLDVAMKVAQSFVSHAAFMKMYSTYINNFDNSVYRIKAWTSDRPGNPPGQTLSPSSSSAQLVGLGISMAINAPGALPDGTTMAFSANPLSSGQRKRIKTYLKRCRMNPRHSQLNLEGYLLLPVQRIPRYRLLLEELVRSSPPLYDYMDDPLERALVEISSLANNMNEGKREAESRRRLVQWQARIRGKFPSPLVQPHRRLIMDGPLHLTRVVRKATVSFEVIDSHGDASEVQVECLSPESNPRALIGILCNDLLVLCRDPSDGMDPNSHVDLWAVLRMQTLPQPASIVHGNALRLVDNKAILYFDAPSTSDALTWFRAINLHIPTSKA